jgi:hypothetical protein
MRRLQVIDDMVECIAAAAALSWWQKELGKVLDDKFWHAQPEERKQQWREAIRAGLGAAVALEQTAADRSPTAADRSPTAADRSLTVVSGADITRWLSLKDSRQRGE